MKVHCFSFCEDMIPFLHLFWRLQADFKVQIIATSEIRLTLFTSVCIMLCTFKSCGKNSESDLKTYQGGQKNIYTFKDAILKCVYIFLYFQILSVPPTCHLGQIMPYKLCMIIVILKWEMHVNIIKIINATHYYWNLLFTWTTFNNHKHAAGLGGSPHSGSIEYGRIFTT